MVVVLRLRVVHFIEIISQLAHYWLSEDNDVTGTNLKFSYVSLRLFQQPVLNQV